MMFEYTPLSNHHGQIGLSEYLQAQAIPHQVLSIIEDAKETTIPVTSQRTDTDCFSSRSPRFPGNQSRITAIDMIMQAPAMNNETTIAEFNILGLTSSWKESRYFWIWLTYYALSRRLFFLTNPQSSSATCPALRDVLSSGPGETRAGNPNSSSAAQEGIGR
jgi:hypothetical protein